MHLQSETETQRVKNVGSRQSKLAIFNAAIPNFGHESIIGLFPVEKSNFRILDKAAERHSHRNHVPDFVTTRER